VESTLYFENFPLNGNFSPTTTPMSECGGGREDHAKEELS